MIAMLKLRASTYIPEKRFDMAAGHSNGEDAGASPEEGSGYGGKGKAAIQWVVRKQ